VAVFQPHRYTRTAALLEEFGRSFFLADVVVVTDVYPAGEDPIAGIDAAAVAASLRRNGHPAVELVPRLQDVPAALRRLVEDGDVVLTLGAGNVRSVGLDLVNARRPRRRKGGK
jgi:UDP-N-acetylmuramate--alanine ligase